MKRNIIFSLIILALITFMSCDNKRTESYTYQMYVPIYKTFSEIRNGVSVKSAQTLKEPGKIYVYGKYLLINEKGKGIHIIDNGNPSSPNPISYIEIPGNYDLAVHKGILYTDSYVDLVAFDISNPAAPKEIKRVESIFPNLLDPQNQYVDPEKGIVVGYDIRDTTVYYEVGSGGLTGPMYDGNSKSAEGSGSGNPTGKGGSMARFTIVGNYMYSVDRTNLQVFDISIADNPRPWSKVNIGWDIETIFPFQNKLFIGSMTGMFIYDISNPVYPTYVSQFSHARTCDPVVAEDNTAYVTLRSGTSCGGNQNQLDILDISNLTSPKLIRTYPMQGPNGLAVDNKTLFICDGVAGLKVFDARNPKEIQLLDWESDIIPYDVILLGSSALVIGDYGVYQYDYSGPKNLKLLSKISVVK